MGQNNSKDNSNSFEQYSIKNIQDLISQSKDVNYKNYNNETFLHFACQNQKENPIEIIKDLIKKGLDINAKTKDYEQTPLHYVCKSQNKNSLEILNILIENGADVNAKTKENQTPLYFACLYQQPNLFEIIQFLVLKGADVNVKTNKNQTPLHFVCRFENSNSFEIIQFLISKGADVNVKTSDNETCLHFACRFGNQKQLEIVKFLVSKGLDVNAKNIHEETPFHLICKIKSQNLFGMIEFFVSNGVDVNAKNNYNQTALHLICENENQNQYQHQQSIKIVKFLISKGADVNVQTKDNQETPLLLIFRNKYEYQIHNPNENLNLFEIIKILIKNKTDVNAKNNFGETPLHYACKSLSQNSFEIVKILVENGADVNAKKNYNLETPLHFICRSQKKDDNTVKIIKFLVENGADINVNTKSNETPLHLICQYQYGFQNISQNLFEITKLFVENGADVNAKNYYQETPLHFICQSLNEDSNSFEIAQLFLSKGADVNAKTNTNKTPLSLAVQYQKKKDNLIDLLLINDANPLDLKYYDLPKKTFDLLNQIYSIIHDFNNLFKSNEDNFPDFEIKSIDSFKFKVHKLILLTRLDNDESILSKFIEICSQKSKEEVEIVLNFIYTGFPNFDIFLQFIESFQKSSLSNNQRDEQEVILNGKEETLKEFFQEIGFDSNWIESKKGKKGILKDLSKLYQQNETKDFTIIISNEKEIKVHKLILIIRSELYKGMFLSVNDSSNQVHDYSKKSIKTIQELIYFLYHDQFENEIPKEIKEEFKDLKDYYQLNQNSIIDLFLKNKN